MKHTFLFFQHFWLNIGFFENQWFSAQGIALWCAFLSEAYLLLDKVNPWILNCAPQVEIHDSIHSVLKIVAASLLNGINGGTWYLTDWSLGERCYSWLSIHREAWALVLVAFGPLAWLLILTNVWEDNKPLSLLYYNSVSLINCLAASAPRNIGNRTEGLSTKQ